MITRLFIGFTAVVSAAVAISAATRAVDFAGSTIEDGPSRFGIAAAAAAVFLACLGFLVADLRRARRNAPDFGDGLDALTTAAANRSISVARPPVGSPDRVASAAAPSPLADRLPGAAEARAEAANVAATRPIFAPATSREPSAAEGLFATRTPQRVTIPTDTAPPTDTPQPTVTAPVPDTVPVPATSEPASSAPQPEPSHAPLDDADTTPPPIAQPSLPTPTTPPVARPLSLDAYSADDIDRTVDAQRNAAVDGLVRSGTLSTHGPLSADDIRTMLFIALSTEQLRSMLHDARADDLPIWVEADEEPPATGHLYVTGG